MSAHAHDRRRTGELGLLGSLLCLAGALGCSVYDPSLPAMKGVVVKHDAGSGPQPMPLDAGMPDAATEADSGRDSGSSTAGAGAGTGGSGSAGCGGAGGQDAACVDGCPLDPDKTDPGECGCGVSELDGDGDGSPDCVDGCPGNPDKQAPGTCGCALSDEDGDGDGTPDCVDGCKGDEDKTDPGECGCGVIESILDSDGDGTPDCIDGCNADPDKQAPGVCGCAVADTDGDLDETPDCMDGCPSDGSKTAPGVCGCGIPDDDSGSVVGCVALKNALVRRYRFDGTGMTVTDSQGGPAGTVVGASLAGNGTLVLTGGSSGPYVDLPNGVLSGMTDATIELWINWGGGAVWQRLFDFGTTGTEGSQGTGTSYLFLTPSAATSNHMRLAFSTNGSTNETQVNSTRALPSGVQHVAVVIDDTNDTMALYLNTTLEGSVAFTDHLSGISDVNDWIGRSQYSADPELTGTISELRIYETALTPAQLSFSLTQGPDPSYLQ